MALKYLVFFCCSQYSLAVRVNLLVFCVFCEIYNFLLKVHLRLVELTIKLLFFECRIIRRFIYLLFFNPRKKTLLSSCSIGIYVIICLNIIACDRCCIWHLLIQFWMHLFFSCLAFSYALITLNRLIKAFFSVWCLFCIKQRCLS